MSCLMRMGSEGKCICLWNSTEMVRGYTGTMYINLNFIMSKVPA